MILRLGIDLGNGFCKYGVGERFASKVKQGELLKLSTSVKSASELHEVVYEDETYIVGEGASFIDEDRYFTKSYEIALLTAIALSNKKKYHPVEAHVVVGVPVEHYNRHAEKIEEHLNKLGSKHIVVDGVHHLIEVKSVTVFIEGALPIRDNDNSHTITIDVGTGTINIIEWNEQSIVNKYTNDVAFNWVFTRIREVIDQKYGMKYSPEECSKFIQNPVINTKTGKVNISEDVSTILEEIIGNMLSYTKHINFNGADAIKVFGGGAIDTFKVWKKYFPKAELIDNSQYINQTIYKAVVEALDEK